MFNRCVRKFSDRRILQWTQQSSYLLPVLSRTEWSQHANSAFPNAIQEAVHHLCPRTCCWGLFLRYISPSSTFALGLSWSTAFTERKHDIFLPPLCHTEQPFYLTAPQADFNFSNHTTVLFRACSSYTVLLQIWKMLWSLPDETVRKSRPNFFIYCLSCLNCSLDSGSIRMALLPDSC